MSLFKSIAIAFVSWLLVLTIGIYFTFAAGYQDSLMFFVLSFIEATLVAMMVFEIAKWPD